MHLQRRLIIKIVAINNENSTATEDLKVTYDGDEIEIWGDGQQTRSFMYIDDCVQGIYEITNSNESKPLNLGMDQMITVDELVDIVSEVSGKNLIKKHDLTKPQGVRGRNSDNSELNNILGWAPEYSLQDGLSITYNWIKNELENKA